MQNSLKLIICFILVTGPTLVQAERVCSNFFTPQLQVTNSSAELLSFFKHYFAREIAPPEMGLSFDLKNQQSLFTNPFKKQDPLKNSIEYIEDLFFKDNPELKRHREIYSEMLPEKMNEVFNPIDESISKSFAYELSRYHLGKIRPQDKEAFEMDFQELLTSFWNSQKEDFATKDRIQLYEGTIHFKPWSLKNSAEYLSVFHEKLEKTLPYVIEVYNKAGFREAKPYRYDEANKPQTIESRLYELGVQYAKAQRLYARLKTRYLYEYEKFMQSGLFASIEKTLIESRNDPSHTDVENSNLVGLSYALKLQKYKIAFAALDVYLSEMDLRFLHIQNNSQKIKGAKPFSSPNEIQLAAKDHQGHRAQFIADLMFYNDFRQRHEAAKSAQSLLN